MMTERSDLQYNNRAENKTKKRQEENEKLLEKNNKHLTLVL